MCKALQIAALITLSIYVLVTPADALSRRNIYGKWCSTGGSEQFAAKTLTAVRAEDHLRTIFNIDRYDFDDETVTVYWTNTDNTKMVTTFGEFSSDGKRMVQIKNDAGPRREFHRC